MLASARIVALLLAVTSVPFAACAAPKDPAKKAATLARNAARPQQILVWVGINGGCEQAHAVAALSRIKEAATGLNATFDASCLYLASSSRPARITITFSDRAVRSAFYKTLHKLIYKTKDKTADVAAFFRGLPASTVTLNKYPSDPPSGFSKVTRQKIAIVVAALAVWLCVAAAATLYNNRSKLPPSVAKYWLLVGFPAASADDN